MEIIWSKPSNYCFWWSILGSFYPCKNNYPKRVSNHREYCNETNNRGFDFSNGFRCIDVHKFEKLKSLFVNIFELNFHQDKNKRKHNLIPFEISKNDSARVVDLLLYKNHYLLNKKLKVFLGDHHKNFICRRCLNLYKSENMLLIHKPKRQNYDITTIRTSSESHIYWKDHFHKNPL